MAHEIYLADTSVLTRINKPPVINAVAGLMVTGRVALCAPVIFELGVTSRSPADYAELMLRSADYSRVPTTEGDQQRALEIQAALVERSQHRAVSVVDALVAAVAEARGLSVLHYDADFELIAAVTGQAHAWVVPRGSAD